jgi:energy-coupling factor transport system ATP-binding protein
VGTVLQNPEEQILATTVEEEVALALEWRATPQEKMTRRVETALGVLEIPHLARRSVFTLSSGERQKCVIASVVAAESEIVVMDEPTANLSPGATEDLARIVASLKRSGAAVVIVDHRLYWLKGVADKVLVLKDGKTAAYVEGRDALSQLESRKTADGLRRIDVERPALRDVAEADEPSAVAIDSISFRHSRRTSYIYRDFSARLPRGGITAVVGPNGAGKTTLAKLVCGLLKPESGEISFDGRPLSAAMRRRDVAFVMQQMDIQLYMRTVREELDISAPRGLSCIDRRVDEKRWLDAFGLAHLADRHPHSLSGGEKQRLVVACALMKRPSLMVLDEPTSGLDGRNMRVIADVLRDYASSGGTVLLITHDLELLSLAATHRLEVAR